MSYTATKYFSPRAFPFPAGIDNTQHLVHVSGNMVDCDTATEYTTGGVGSTSFEVTAFSAVGLVTFSAMKGVPLVNGQLVVVYNTGSNTNDGTYTVSGLDVFVGDSRNFRRCADPELGARRKRADFADRRRSRPDSIRTAGACDPDIHRNRRGLERGDFDGHVYDADRTAALAYGQRDDCGHDARGK